MQRWGDLRSVAETVKAGRMWDLRNARSASQGACLGAFAGFSIAEAGWNRRFCGNAREVCAKRALAKRLSARWGRAPTAHRLRPDFALPLRKEVSRAEQVQAAAAAVQIERDHCRLRGDARNGEIRGVDETRHPFSKDDNVGKAAAQRSLEAIAQARGE